MSSAFIPGRYERWVKSISGFRYVDFLIKSSPVVSLAFIIYVTFKGVLWR